MGTGFPAAPADFSWSILDGTPREIKLLQMLGKR